MGGFLTAEITFTNESEFPVHGVIIALGRRGDLIPRIPPGETTIDE